MSQTIRLRPAILLVAALLTCLVHPPAKADTTEAIDQLMASLEQMMSQRLLPLSDLIAARPELTAKLSAQARVLKIYLQALEPRVEAEGDPSQRRRLAALVQQAEALGATEMPAPVISKDKTTTRSGGLTGRVTHAATGDPLPFYAVVIDAQVGSLISSTLTDADGVYSFDSLEEDNYFVATAGLEEFVDEIYDGKPCNLVVGCDFTTGDPVAVVADTVTTGIDFALDRGGRIEGAVTVAGELPGRPVIEIWTPDRSLFSLTGVDEQGRYSVGGLPPSSYWVTGWGFGIVPELYDNIPCPGSSGSCPFDDGTAIPVTPESVTTEINFDLDSLGVISGTVTDVETGAPIAEASITAWTALGHPQRFGVTDTSGHYVVERLEPGNHFITVRAFRYLGLLYDGLPCDEPPFDCLPSSGGGTPVAAAINTTTSGINFAMTRRPAGSISGTVRAEPENAEGIGEPIVAAEVRLWHDQGLEQAFTNSDGFYQADDLVPGTYFVSVKTSGRFNDELYDNLPCPEGQCASTSGTPIAVLDATITSDIDFALTRRGTISGTVRDSLLGHVINATVRAWTPTGELAGSASSNLLGNYSIEGLDPGTYFVDTLNHENFQDEVFDNLPCPPSGCDPTTGTPLQVAFNAPITDINFELDLLQGIRGRILREDLGLPLFFATLNFFDADGNLIGHADPDTNGEYRRWLPAGTYFVTTDEADIGFNGIDELYDNLPCPNGECDPRLGTPVMINENTITEGIDFALATSVVGCTADKFWLCLANDRFRVQARWRAFDGANGLATVDTELTDATGTFYFFDSDNVELIVKVLDACVEPFHRFWVFAAGLTNVEVELFVTDTLSGETRTYANALGQAFEPIQDTDAFATCDASPRAGFGDGESLAEQTRRELLTQLAQLRNGQTFPRRPLTSASVEPKQGACTPTDTSLCLEQGRFRVESTWRTPAGEEGDGQAVQLTDATGTFWFFSPDNVEALVKVLDACELPGFESFWVFAAGLTDVAVTIRVTDTVSGEVREYSNPQSTPFLPVQDTSAFETCASGDG